MMPHLEQVHVPDPPPHGLLGRYPGITHEDGAETAILHQKHHRIVIEVEPPPGPGRIRMQDSEVYAVEHELFTPARPGPGGARLCHLGQEFAVDGIGRGRGRFEDRGHRQLGEHRPKPADMVGVGM